MQKLSIITINYNNKYNLEKTILSVINQNFKFEFVVIDGGSTDGSKGIIDKYSKDIDKYISEPDLGIYDAMNKGIDICSGDWLIFMNSGDEFHCSSTLSDIFNSQAFANSYDCIVGNTLLIHTNKKNNKVQNFNLNKRRFIHQSVIYRKQLHMKYGSYIVDKFISASDYFLISKVIENEKVLYIDSIFSNYDVGGVSDNIVTNVQVLMYDYLSRRITYSKLIFSLLFTPTLRAIIRMKKILLNK